jgi:hypothetical protein
MEVDYQMYVATAPADGLAVVHLLLKRMKNVLSRHRAMLLHGTGGGDGG